MVVVVIVVVVANITAQAQHVMPRHQERKVHSCQIQSKYHPSHRHYIPLTLKPCHAPTASMFAYLANVSKIHVCQLLIFKRVVQFACLNTVQATVKVLVKRWCPHDCWRKLLVTTVTNRHLNRLTCFTHRILFNFSKLPVVAGCFSFATQV